MELSKFEIAEAQIHLAGDILMDAARALRDLSHEPETFPGVNSTCIEAFRLAALAFHANERFRLLHEISLGV